MKLRQWMFDGGPLDSFKRCPKVCYNRWGIHVPTKHILTLAPKHSICFILEKVRYLPDIGRLLRDPGIFSKSQSRYSQKSNPGIFQDFQKPLNDCILRLSTPFIDHNKLFWDLWSLQEHIEHIAVLYFLVIWVWKSSTECWLHISGM